MNKLPKPSDRRVAGKAAEGDLPEDPVQECVLRSVRTVLGKDDIYLSDGFFAAGGDSLRWMQLLLELEASGLQAEAEDIIASSDLRELSAAVSRRTYGAEDGRVWSPVLPLRTGAAGEPIVFMHVTPGDVMAYASVVDALGPQNPCYGVISPGLRADGALPESFSAMAEGYAEELLKSDVKAPYHLAGWCFGGVLAFEVARHLEARGAAIAGLYLIETPCPEMLASRVSRLRWRIACALHGGPDAVLDLAFRRLRETPGFGTAAGPGEGGELDLDEEYFLERTEIHMANMRALQNYRPGHFGGKVTLLCSEQRIDHDAMGWRFGKCADEIEVVTLPGSHVGVLHQEGAIKIANELAQRASGR